ncbi:MAG: SDR family oxidoreductase [Burkholderiales bacterium]|nr:SDR family oxidoreductase [Burkholderiales bacterium]
MSKHVLITGAGRGIGAATARLAALRGHAVAVNYVANDAAARGVVEWISAQGGRAIAVRGDMSSEADVERVFGEAIAAFGPLSALVNNAGVPGKIGRVENLDFAVLKRTFEVNVFAAFLCARAFARHASVKHGGAGGAIVNVSSMASKTGSPNELVHYAAAKAALETFNYGFAAEVAAEGIRVNAVSCGLIETDIHAEAGDASRLARYATRMPMARAGKPEEVANAILWLLSEEASYVTGATLPVAGGR